MEKETIHTLPNFGSGDITWFERQNKFEQHVIQQQVDFKNHYFPELKEVYGRASKYPQHKYIHILPSSEYQEKVYYPGFAQKILSYVQENDIAIHTESLNLKSSQVCCLNILFYLRENLEIATKSLQPFLKNLNTIENIEFEYTGSSDVTEWLGEPASGKRGQNRTSIDALITWKDQDDCTCFSLIEWKYTEKNYGGCSFYSNVQNKEASICKSIPSHDIEQLTAKCPLMQNGMNKNRKYWSNIQHIVNMSIFTQQIGCPFKGALYQLIRQYMVAHYLQQHNVCDKAGLVSIHFKDNVALQTIPREMTFLKSPQHRTILDVFNQLTEERIPYKTWFIEDIFQQIDLHDEYDKEWRQYIQLRYGL
jgi:hypothetical protein